VRIPAWAAAALIALAATPATHAYAHEGDPRFRSELSGIEPRAEGLEVEVLNYDDSLELRNRSGEDVLVRGYDDEPYVRILADGTVQVNTRSPAYYLNDDRYAEVDVPPEADAAAPPQWKTLDTSGIYAWHDHRIHYMSEGTPPQVRDEGERTDVFDYSVPIEVGGRAAAVTGTLVWVGEDDGAPVWPFIALGAAALALVALVAVRRRRGRPEVDSAEAGAGSKEAW
jgi:MYXO-CTERM domain-containing protein